MEGHISWYETTIALSSMGRKWLRSRTAGDFYKGRKNVLVLKYVGVGCIRCMSTLEGEGSRGLTCAVGE